MRYRLRTLLIVLALGPPVIAAAWGAAQLEWSDNLLLLVALTCAVPYWAGIAILLARNYQKPSAWAIAIPAALIWPALFFMSFTQLVFVIPVWTVLLSNGGDLSKPIRPATIGVALGSTVAFIVWVAAVVMIHD